MRRRGACVGATFRVRGSGDPWIVNWLAVSRFEAGACEVGPFYAPCWCAIQVWIACSVVASASLGLN